MLKAAVHIPSERSQRKRKFSSKSTHKSFSEPLWAALGTTWAPLGHHLATIWDPLAPLWGALGTTWAPLEPLWAALGVTTKINYNFWTPFGSYFLHFFVLLMQKGTHLKHVTIFFNFGSY